MSSSASENSTTAWKKRLNKIMTWTSVNPDTGKPVQMPLGHELDEAEDATPKDKAAELPTLKEQMEDEDRGFQEGVSAYSVEHFNAQTLNMITCVVPDTEEALANCFIVWPGKMADDVSSKEELMALTDRVYNAVAMNQENGHFVFFRLYSTDEAVLAHTIPLEDQKKHFAWALSDPVRQTILDSKNTRVVECVVPYKNGGTVIKCKLPHIPDELYKQIVKEERSRKQKETLALKRKKKEEEAAAAAAAAAAEDPDVEEKSTGEEKPRKTLSPAKVKKEEKEDKDEGEQAAKKQKATGGAKKVPAKAAKVLEEASVKTGSRKRASPSAKDAEEETARVEFREGGWFIPRLAPRLLTGNNPVPTLPQILAHLEAKAATGFRFADPFAGKRTMGGVMKDEHCVYAINGTAVVLQQFAPEMLGIAQHMPVPKDIAQEPLKKLL